MSARVCLLLLASGCAALVDEQEPPDAGVDAGEVIDPPAGPFTLASTMLANGGTFDTANTCEGANTSPELVWTNPPVGTRSYAVVLTDIERSIVQWVIFDVPASATGLPPGVQKVYSPSNVPGAHQTESFQPSVTGYLGPCPPPGQGTRTYDITLYALDVAQLPGASPMTTRLQALGLIAMHTLATTRLVGMYAR
jgi:Raf kinase inhibitor-like YbhB/YbcL family protein